MKHIKLEIAITELYQEILIVELEEMGFEGYQLFDNSIEAYIVQNNFHIDDRERIEQLLNGFPGHHFIQSEQVVADKNWNTTWEKTIQPQSIGTFFVKPTWSTKNHADEDQIVLEIDPKQAFGTGYHATTRLMLNHLPALVHQDSRVLDAGTGTGILAIAAAKMGVDDMVAFDNDEWSIQNAKENILINKVDHTIDLRYGSTEVLKQDEKFDVILANIQKNIIFEMLPTFQQILNEEGTLLLSGFLLKDKTTVEGLLEPQDFVLKAVYKEEEWMAIEVTKK